MLYWVVSTAGSMLTRAVAPPSPMATPAANGAPTIGIPMFDGVPSGLLVALPLTAASRPGVPWLKMMMASAPAASARVAFSEKKQAPRWTRAMSMSPDQSMPAKSAASHPLVEAAGSSSDRSTGMTGPMTSPVPEPLNDPVSYSTATGDSCSSSPRAVKVNGKPLSSTS